MTVKILTFNYILLHICIGEYMFTEPSVNYVFTEPSDHIVDDTAFDVLATGRTLDLKHK